MTSVDDASDLRGEPFNSKNWSQNNSCKASPEVNCKEQLFVMDIILYSQQKVKRLQLPPFHLLINVPQIIFQPLTPKLIIRLPFKYIFQIYNG